MNLKRGNILIIAPIIFAILGIATAGYFYLKNNNKFCGGLTANFPEYQCSFPFVCRSENNYPDASGKCILLFKRSDSPLPPNKATSLADPTANWKTYTNSSDGYTIKYPANYSVSEVPPDYVRFSPGFNDPKGPQSETYLSIQLDLKPDLSKNPAAIYKTTSDGETLRISQIMMGLDESQKPLVQAVFDQILSTFKFLNETKNVSAVCSDEKFGYKVGDYYECQNFNVLYPGKNVMDAPIIITDKNWKEIDSCGGMPGPGGPRECPKQYNWDKCPKKSCN